MSRLRHFLLVFDHREGSMLWHEEFDSLNRAVTRYGEVEQQYDTTDHVEVVLIGSDSLDTISRTHPNYFGGAVSTARNEYLADL